MTISETGRYGDAPRVLVVDDERVIREILADFLSLEGFIVDTASDGLAALRLLGERHFDLVISDLKMPNMGGLELLEQIRAKHENVLTVIMTGFGTVETAIEAMKKGAYDYILKPFKVEEVVHIVHRGLEKQRLISENIRLKEILSYHELSEQLASTLSVTDVFDSTLRTVSDNIGCELAAIYLRDEVSEEFVEAGRRQNTTSPEPRDGGQLSFDTILGELDERRVVLAHGGAAKHYFVKPPPDLAAFMCIPLVARQRVIGLLAGWGFSAESYFTEGQRKLLAMLGTRSAAAIDNALLYRDLQQTFRQTIQGLARALEAMDKYTAGHSDRVTVYSRITAEELGEPPERVELITQAGMLHDIGKLGCHTNLNKPGKLTAEEYEIFRAHPLYGKEILEPISFLRPLIPGILLHHERWDGQGYPVGLAGPAIPRVARILAVADTYDAMTSNRAYRRALSHSVAVAELQRCAGTQFDPESVEAFVRAIDRYRHDAVAHGIPIPD